MKTGIRALCRLNRFESQENPSERGEIGEITRLTALSLVLQWIADSPKASSCYRTDKISSLPLYFSGRAKDDRRREQEKIFLCVFDSLKGTLIHTPV